MCDTYYLVGSWWQALSCSWCAEFVSVCVVCGSIVSSLV
jgi:hypothetical protein